MRAQIEEDPETGELLVAIPGDIIERLGWVEGDDLIGSLSKDGASVTFKKQAHA